MPAFPSLPAPEPGRSSGRLPAAHPALWDLSRVTHRLHYFCSPACCHFMHPRKGRGEAKNNMPPTPPSPPSSSHQGSGNVLPAAVPHGEKECRPPLHQAQKHGCPARGCQPQLPQDAAAKSSGAEISFLQPEPRVSGVLAQVPIPLWPRPVRWQ